MNSEVVIQATGEVISLASATPEEVIASLRIADSSYEGWRQMKSMLRERAVELMQQQLREKEHHARQSTETSS